MKKTKNENYSYNLIDEPWIQVRTKSGDLISAGIQDILSHSEDYLRIEDSSPLVVVAIHRFLIAILHRALKGPIKSKQSADWMNMGFPQKEVKEYLKKYEDRFDLFHTDRPFYQLPDLTIEQYPKFQSEISTISARHGSSNTNFLYNPVKRFHVETANLHFTPAEAARAILEHQTFVLGGLIKRFMTSAPTSHSATAAFILVHGESLRETLLLNMTLYDEKVWEKDLPFWEKESFPYTAKKMEKNPQESIPGIVSFYTGFHRSIKLIPEVADGIVSVSQIMYAAGVTYKESGLRDPMVAYRNDPKLGPRQMQLREDKKYWRDFTSLLPVSEQEEVKGKDLPNFTPPGVILQAGETIKYAKLNDKKLHVYIAGLINEKAKIKLWRSEYYRFPEVLTSDQEIRGVIEEALNEANDGWSKLNSATWHLAGGLLAKGDRNPHKNDVQKLQQTLPTKEIYWSTLEQSFHQLLSRFDPEFNKEDLLNWWKKEIAKIIQRAWDQTLRTIGQDAKALKAETRVKGMIYSYVKKLENNSAN